jgi:hypothetical protein
VIVIINRLRENYLYYYKILYFGPLLGDWLCLLAMHSRLVIKEKWINATTWEWQADLPEPVISITGGEKRFSSIAIDGLENAGRSGYPVLPVYRKLFNALPEEITYQLNSDHRPGTQLVYPAEVFQDVCKDGDSPAAPEILPESINLTTATIG